MPIPKPTSTETQKQFIKRCMADTTIAQEFPVLDQRYAICIAQYQKK